MTRREKIRAALCFLPLLLSAAGTRALAPKTPPPTQRLALADYGFPGYSSNLMDTGSALLTAHFADDTHLLLTYSLRDLVEREAGEDPDESHRAVAALLIELPSGKVVARARWHLHDHGQYLWPLGRGRFLLRRGSHLFSIAPMANLGGANTFRETPFVQLHDPIDVVNPSIDGNVVTVETSPVYKREPHKIGAPILLNAEDETPERVETYHFIRVTGSGTAADPIAANLVGSAHVDAAILLPINDHGYLYSTAESRDRWRLHFESFDGDTRQLEYVDSSCPPHLQWTAPAQFVTFTCRGSNEQLMISSFDFVPRETWEEGLSGTNAYAHFRTAPAAGRFAISRIISNITYGVGGGAQATALGSPGATQDQFTTQEVRVYQAVSGDLFLTVSTDPVFRNGQNFDLSEDGRTLLVVRNKAIELYPLPAVSKVDQRDLAEVSAKAPATPKSERIELRKLLHAAMPQNKTAVIEPTEPQPPSSATPAAASPAAVATEPAPVEAGDTTKRKPPTLLHPGETPEKH